jgi:hypothetical protein
VTSCIYISSPGNDTVICHSVTEVSYGCIIPERQFRHVHSTSCLIICHCSVVEYHLNGQWRMEDFLVIVETHLY